MRAESDYQDIRIFVNGILHILLPRGRTRLQAWYEGSRATRIYKIEVKVITKQGALEDEYHYDNFENWKKVLELLNEHIQ